MEVRWRKKLPVAVALNWGGRDFPGLPLNCGPCFCILGAWTSLYSGRVHEWGQWVVPVEALEEGPEQTPLCLEWTAQDIHQFRPETTEIVRRPHID